MTSIEELRAFRLLTDLSEKDLHSVATMCKTVTYLPGDAIITEGKEANACWLIRHGLVALDVRLPNGSTQTVQTLGAGDVLGWSWLLEPYKWRFDAHAVEPVEALEIDGAWLRALAAEYPELGFALATGMLEIVADRLHATRVRLTDLYGGTDGG
jgi:CRP/FNR family transcriptional regulator, cyclic AMP receptor protein